MNPKIKIHLIASVFFLAYGSLAHALSPETEFELRMLREQGRRQGWTFEIGYSTVMENTLSENTGFRIDPKWKREPFISVNSRGTLPSSFDWRETPGGLTPVKAQGKCGSCWAFATVAVFESLIKIRTGMNVNFSEQQLISCNTKGWGCDGGSLAHRYHLDPGAAYGEDFPYQEADAPCRGFQPRYRISNWAYLRPIAGLVFPLRVKEIKKAIYQFGPVGASVFATKSFLAYSGGVYNADDGTGLANHLITLVGWNDRDQAWILRNSWGPNWGENGYMRIRYGVNNIARFVTVIR